jgi:hypothetical protein
MTRPGCDYVRAELDELIDGPLDPQRATTVQAHLEICPECRSAFEATRQLKAAARNLPESIEPARDLWPGIAGRLQQRSVVRGRFDRRRRLTASRLGALAAAAAVLVAAIGIAYFAGLHQARTRTAQAPVSDTAYQTAAYTGFETDLVQARDQLFDSLLRRQDELTPATWSVVMDNLEVIDDAIARIETAIDANPGDDGLNRRLTVAYQRQIELLRRANLLPAEI